MEGFVLSLVDAKVESHLTGIIKSFRLMLRIEHLQLEYYCTRGPLLPSELFAQFLFLNVFLTGDLIITMYFNNYVNDKLGVKEKDCCLYEN